MMEDMRNALKDDPANQPIDVDDAASCFRVRVPKNEKPYTIKVLELNNQKVSKWKKTMLMDIAADSGGKLPAGKVQDMWSLFEEQYEISKMNEIGHMLPRMSPEQLQFWISAFRDKDVEELYNMGVSNIAIAWTSLMNEVRLWFAEQKQKHIFVEGQSPKEWYNNARDHRNIAEGKKHPFWESEDIKEIGDKVMTILNYRIRAAK